MKSRNGFVSNSSTSSFIILLKNDAYNEKYKEADDYTKAVLDVVVGSPKTDEEASTVFGIPCRIVEFSDGNYDSFNEYYEHEVDWKGEIPEEYDPDYYGCASRDAFEKFTDKLENEKEIETFSVET